MSTVELSGGLDMGRCSGVCAPAASGFAEHAHVVNAREHRQGRDSAGSPSGRAFARWTRTRTPPFSAELSAGSARAHARGRFGAVRCPRHRVHAGYDRLDGVEACVCPAIHGQRRRHPTQHDGQAVNGRQRQCTGCRKNGSPSFPPPRHLPVSTARGCSR